MLCYFTADYGPGEGDVLIPVEVDDGVVAGLLGLGVAEGHDVGVGVADVLGVGVADVLGVGVAEGHDVGVGVVDVLGVGVAEGHDVGVGVVDVLGVGVADVLGVGVAEGHDVRVGAAEALGFIVRIADGDCLLEGESVIMPDAPVFCVPAPPVGAALEQPDLESEVQVGLVRRAPVLIVVALITP